MNNSDIIAATLPRIPAYAQPAPSAPVSADTLWPAQDEPGMFSFASPDDSTSIINPCASETLEAYASPSHYGFKVISTGGGCTAWHREFILDGRPVYVLLTDDDAGHKIGPGEGFILGIYSSDDNSGEALYWYELQAPGGPASGESGVDIPDHAKTIARVCRIAAEHMSRSALREWYEDNVGYDPVSDNPAMLLLDLRCLVAGAMFLRCFHEGLAEEFVEPCERMLQEAMRNGDEF